MHNDKSLLKVLAKHVASKSTGIVAVRTTFHEGKMYLIAGALTYAQTTQQSAEDAISTIATWPASRVAFKSVAAEKLQEHNLTRPTPELIQEIERLHLQVQELLKTLPPLDQALDIDAKRMLDVHPEPFTSKIENILAEFNGKRSLQDIIEHGPYAPLVMLETIHDFFLKGLLIVSQHDTTQDKKLDEQSQTIRTFTKLPTGGTLDTARLTLDDQPKSIAEIKSKARRRQQTPVDMQPSEPENKTEKTLPPTTSQPNAEEAEPDSDIQRHDRVKLHTLLEQSIDQWSPTQPPQDYAPIELQKTRTFSETNTAVSSTLTVKSSKKAAKKTNRFLKTLVWLLPLVLSVAILIFLVLPKQLKKTVSTTTTTKNINDDLQTLNTRINQAFRQQQWQETITLANQILGLVQNQPQALWLKAFALKELGQYKEAKQAFGTVWLLDPTLKEARLSELILTYQLDGYQDQTQRQVTAFLANLDPTTEEKLYADTLVLYLTMLINQSDWEKARQVVYDLPASLLDNPQINNLLLQIPPQQEALPTTQTNITSTTATLETPPKIPQQEKQAATKPVVLKKTFEKKPIALEPQTLPIPEEISAEAYYQQARMLQNRGEFRQASDILVKAMTLNAKYDAFWFTYGEIQFELRNYEQAERGFLEATRINSKYALAYRKLGTVYAVTNQIERAKDAFNLYLEMVPKNSEAAREVRLILKNL